MGKNGVNVKIRKNMKKSRISDSLYRGLVGIVIGAGLMLGVENINSITEKARFIEKQDMPRIMKIYNFWTKDQLLVEDPENAGKYITLPKYLKYKNKCEKRKIECIVSHEEKKYKK